MTQGLRRVKCLLLLQLAFFPLHAQYTPLADSLQRLTGFAPAAGNTIRVTKSGQEFMNMLLEDVRAARESVEIEYYWFDNDEAGQMLRAALMDKAREGIQVRVIMDNLIDPTAPEAFYDKLRSTGADVRYYRDLSKLPFYTIPATVMGQRDHKKIVVIDNTIGYTGGMNFCDNAAFNWEIVDDLRLKIEGGFEDWRQSDDRFYGISTKLSAQDSDVPGTPSSNHIERFRTRYRNTNTLNYDFKNIFKNIST